MQVRLAEEEEGVGAEDVDVPAELQRESPPPPPRPPPRHDEIESTACQQSIKQISSPCIITPKRQTRIPSVFPSNESSGKMVSCIGGGAAASVVPSDVKGEAYSEMDRMAVDPIHLAQLSTRLDEEENEEDCGEG